MLRSVLIDLAQTSTITTSLQIGSAILRQLGLFSRLHYHKVEQAAFVVLKSPDIPSLLVESGFLRCRRSMRGHWAWRRLSPLRARFLLLVPRPPRRRSRT